MVIDEPTVQDVVRILAAEYDGPHRRYHTRRHVDEVCSALRELMGSTELHPALELAAWAHDAVYDPRAPAGQNEEASAALARDLLSGHGAPDCLTAEVVALVRATADHEPPGHGTTAGATGEAGDEAPEARMAAFLDADLWILAAPAHRFAEYEAQVRGEYAFVPDDLFAQGRAAILDTLARRDRIYRTDRAFRAWESSARSNLSRIGHHGRSPQRPGSSAGVNQPTA